MPTGAIEHVVGGLVVACFLTISSSVASAQPPANRTATLPAAVLKAFQQAYPSATIRLRRRNATGTGPCSGWRVSTRVAGRSCFTTPLYHLTVRGSRRTAMIAKPDGTVLSFE